MSKHLNFKNQNHGCQGLSKKHPIQRNQRPDERLKLKEKKPRFQNKNKSAFQKAKTEFLQKQENIAKSKEEKARKHKEKLEAIEQYKKKKEERSSILKKKTRKGQPLMKGRIDLLLEKIQRTIANES